MKTTNETGGVKSDSVWQSLRDYMGEQLTNAAFILVRVHNKTITDDEGDDQVNECISNCIQKIEESKLSSVTNDIVIAFGEVEATKIMMTTSEKLKECYSDPKFQDKSNAKSRYASHTMDIFTEAISNTLDVITVATDLGYFNTGHSVLTSELANIQAGKEMRNNVDDFIENITNRTVEILRDCWTENKLFPEETTAKLLDVVNFINMEE